MGALESYPKLNNAAGLDALHGPTSEAMTIQEKTTTCILQCAMATSKQPQISDRASSDRSRASFSMDVFGPISCALGDGRLAQG